MLSRMLCNRKEEKTKGGDEEVEQKAERSAHLEGLLARVGAHVPLEMPRALGRVAAALHRTLVRLVVRRSRGPSPATAPATSRAACATCPAPTSARRTAGPRRVHREPLRHLVREIALLVRAAARRPRVEHALTPLRPQQRVVPGEERRHIRGGDAFQ